MWWPLPPDVDTPALVVDHETLVANIAGMASALSGSGAALRPHTKTHKSVDIAALQLAHGASGLTVASLGEAEVMAAAGYDDLFVAYPVVALRPKVGRLRALASAVRLSLGVDSAAAAALLVAAGIAGELRVLVEIDSGQHRTGVAPEAAGDLASRCADLGLEIEGVFTHPGHAYRSPGAPAEAARAEHAALSVAVEALGARGIVARRVSGGSTVPQRGSE